MPEIKHNFMKGKMNKDLDERLVPNGEYRDAMNIQVSTSEGSDVGTVQNILGNSLISGQGFVAKNAVCVGSVADEKNDKLYYFITQKELLGGIGSFTDGGWVIDDHDAWTISGGKAIASSGSSGRIQAAASLYEETTYRLSYTVLSPSDDGFGLLLANHAVGGANVDVPGENIIGTHSLEWVNGDHLAATSENPDGFYNSFRLYCYPGGNPTVSNLTIFDADKAHSMIVEYDSKTNTMTPVIVDMIGDVLKFNEHNTITGINIIDNLLLWTDNATEPKKINIDRCKAGTNDNGRSHTNLRVEGVNEGHIKEEHITVIKKSPSQAPGLSPTTNIKTGYTSGDMKKRPYFYPPGANAAGVADAAVEEHHEMWIGMENHPSTDEQPLIVAGDTINVYRGFTIPDYNEETPIARLLVKEVKPSGSQFFHPQIQNNFDNTVFISGYLQIAIKVAVSRLVPHSPFPNLANPQYHFQLEQGGKGIFERKFPRFAYRYKYEDNEYSSVGPFSEVVFAPGKFEYHPTKAYNEGMINNLKELTLKDFVTTDIPDDVVQIDLLYKNEFSPNIYVVKTIDKGTNSWAAGGAYTITTENVYAQIPSNQLIRPWDNVPKKALAQEVTGNRVVYGNYFQNYNLENIDSERITPDLTASLDSRFEVYTEGAGVKSIKSQRTYNFGIVYGDEYGRETPVFTNDEANQLVTKSSSASGNAITINVNNDPPGWADYYKIFVKETSNEYYNIAMGRMYDAEDGNVWLSFPSADRNKVDEDTYLVLKKGAGENGDAVFEEARYKVVAIENEAPEYIKTTYDIIAEPTKPLSTYSMFGGAGFKVSYPASIPLPGRQDFTLRTSTWLGVDPTKSYHLQMPNMKEVWDERKEAELYVSFSNVAKDIGASWNNSPIRMSDKYKVVSVEGVDGDTKEPGYSGGAMWRFKLSEVIPASDGWYTDSVGTGLYDPSSIDNGGRLKPHFYKKIVENKPEFDGRFFVKIIEDGVIKKYLTVDAPKNDQGWKVEAAIDQLYYVADEAAPTVAVGTTIISDNSTRKLDWYSNLGGKGGSRWFIDAASFAGSQPNDQNHPKHAVWKQENEDLSDVDSDYGYAQYNDNIDQVPAVPLLDLGIYNLLGAMPDTGRIAFTYDGLNGGHLVDFPSDPTPHNPSFLTYNHEAYSTSNSLNGGELDPDGSGLNIPKANWVWTNLYKSEIVVETKHFGTKISKGVAFQKGVHTASYSDDPGVLADLTGNGGYRSELVSIAANIPTSFYLHLSFGGIGPVRNVANTVPSSFGLGDKYKDTFWTNYIWEKNWEVGNPGGNSSTDNQYPVVSRLTHGSLFRLVGDNNIYKIKSVSVRRLYNHQGQYNQAVEWFNEFEAFMLDYNAPTITYVQTNFTSWTAPQFNETNEILPVALQYAVEDHNESLTGFNYWNDTTVFGQHQRMIQPDNCRKSFLIKYEVLDSSVNKLLADDTEMFDLSLNTQFDTSIMNVTDFGRLEFVSEFSTNVDNLLTTNPAIFETEPKEDVGLDIYYEATGKIPTNASLPSSKVQNLIYVGATLSITPATTAGGATGIFVNSIDFDGSDWIITVSSPVDITNLEGENTILKFHNDDGTYATASWISPSSGISPSAGAETSQLRVAIHTNTIGLGWFNCWSFGNGVESNRIGDTYNKPYITNGVKASTTLLDSYREEHRKYGLIYSGIYNSTSGVNDLNQFIAAEKITKDVNPSYGSIQKLHSRSSADGDLITLCEDRILKILANKDALYNADGNPQLIANNNVLGQAIPFSGEFGISTNPESFASESYRVYFTDKIRRAVMRLSRDGLTPISDHGMKDWFRDNLKLSTKLIGSYDDRNDEYNITLLGGTVLGDELIINGDFVEDPATDWFQSGTADHWVWENYDQNVKADGDAHNRIGQVLPEPISLGKSYEVAWTSAGENGRAWVTLHDANGNYKTISPYPANYEGKTKVTVTVGGGFNHWPYGGSLENSINFHIKEGDTGEWFDGTITDVSVKEILPAPKTVSFREDVKGWVSFKSFIPENALSMASDYYSMVGGKLYLHNDEGVDRNRFYGIRANSSVNVLLNDLPGTIKTFHTLNYEGSQSKVRLFEEKTINGEVYDNKEIYNRVMKRGWFVSTVKTNKQEGSLVEFIEKEGKWFNYIKGVSPTTSLVGGSKGLGVSDFGAFDLQGIGRVASTVVNPLNPDGSSDNIPVIEL